MKLCILCDEAMETKKDGVFVTGRWAFKDSLQKNRVQRKDRPRVAKPGKACWNAFRNKPQSAD